jgi:hypothetical protein
MELSFCLLAIGAAVASHAAPPAFPDGKIHARPLAPEEQQLRHHDRAGTLSG